MHISYGGFERLNNHTLESKAYELYLLTSSNFTCEASIMLLLLLSCFG